MTQSLSKEQLEAIRQRAHQCDCIDPLLAHISALESKAKGEWAEGVRAAAKLMADEHYQITNRADWRGQDTFSEIYQLVLDFIPQPLIPQEPTSA
jgi:hypothetical protein